MSIRILIEVCKMCCLLAFRHVLQQSLERGLLSDKSNQIWICRKDLQEEISEE